MKLLQRPFRPPNERRMLTFSLWENPGDPQQYIPDRWEHHHSINETKS
jgi:hypothetical protein